MSAAGACAATPTAAQLGGNGSTEGKAGALLGWMSAAEDRMPRGDTPDELRRRLLDEDWD